MVPSTENRPFFRRAISSILDHIECWKALAESCPKSDFIAGKAHEIQLAQLNQDPVHLYFPLKNEEKPILFQISISLPDKGDAQSSSSSNDSIVFPPSHLRPFLHPKSRMCYVSSLHQIAEHLEPYMREYQNHTAPILVLLDCPGLAPSGSPCDPFSTSPLTKSQFFHTIHVAFGAVDYTLDRPVYLICAQDYGKLFAYKFDRFLRKHHPFSCLAKHAKIKGTHFGPRSASALAAHACALHPTAFRESPATVQLCDLESLGPEAEGNGALVRLVKKIFCNHCACKIPALLSSPAASPILEGQAPEAHPTTASSASTATAASSATIMAPSHTPSTASSSSFLFPAISPRETPTLEQPPPSRFRTHRTKSLSYPSRPSSSASATREENRPQTTRTRSSATLRAPLQPRSCPAGPCPPPRAIPTEPGEPLSKSFRQLSPPFLSSSPSSVSSASAAQRFPAACSIAETPTSSGGSSVSLPPLLSLLVHDAEDYDEYGGSWRRREGEGENPTPKDGPKTNRSWS